MLGSSLRLPPTYIDVEVEAVVIVIVVVVVVIVIVSVVVGDLYGSSSWTTQDPKFMKTVMSTKSSTKSSP